MSRKEDTVLFPWSDRLWNSVKLLYTAYLPMLKSSANGAHSSQNKKRILQVMVTESPGW